MTTATISDDAAAASINAACRSLHLPAVRAEAGPTADAAVRDRLTHRAYLTELLAAETDARSIRRRERRIKEARFPRIKTLEAFDTGATPDIPSSLPTTLASGAWIDRGEPLALLGDSGPG
jgi:DNA replication protein DnaC